MLPASARSERSHEDETTQARPHHLPGGGCDPMVKRPGRMFTLSLFGLQNRRLDIVVTLLLVVLVSAVSDSGSAGLDLGPG